MGTGTEGFGRITPWIVIAVFVGIGYASMLAPGGVDEAAPATAFSAERALAHVRVIAREPHPMGTAAIRAVRGYILGELERQGIAVDRQAITVPNFFGRGEPIEVVNLIAKIPGTATTKAVALVGHYDTVPATPGGNDNSTAVATLLEAGRALRAGPALRNDVYLIFTDAEEPAPRHGARAFAADHPAYGQIGLVVNLEASGGSGASVLAETSGPERWLIDGLSAADPAPASFSFLTETTRLMGDVGTDFDVFRNAGIPGFHFAYLHGSPIYHTAADDSDAVSAGSLQHHGEHALGIARHFGAIDLSAPGPADRVVYFTVRPLFIRYPASWALPLALLALAVWSIGLWRSRETLGVTAPGMALGVIRTIGAGLLGALVGTLLWLLITAMRSTPGVLESCLYLACVLALSVWIAVKTSSRRGDRDRLGVMATWIAVALSTALWLPGLSYLFVWPALAGAVALWWEADGGAARVLRFSLVAAPALILLIPAIDVFFQMAQPRPGNADSQMMSAVALPLLLALMAAGLLRIVWPASRLRT